MSKKKETPQEMIQRGIDAGDMELIKIGRDLLVAKLEKTQKKVVNTSESKTVSIKKRGRPKKVLTEPPTDVILTAEESPTEQVDQYDVNQFNIQLRKPKEFRPGEVNSDGKRVPRREPVDITKIGKINTFKDQHDLVPVDKEAKERYVMPPVPRREASDIVPIPCSVCNSKRMLSAKAYKNKPYVCDRCITKKGKFRP